MTVLSITTAIFSNDEETQEILAKRLECEVVSDQEIIDRTAEKQGLKLKSIIKTVESKNIALNDFTFEREKCIAGLKKTLAEYVQGGNCIIYGNLGHLIPTRVSHMLKVLLITDKAHRIQTGMAKGSLPEAEADKMIREADKTAIFWTNGLFEKKAWDPSLYDLVVPTDKLSPLEIAEMIIDASEKVTASEEIVRKNCSDFTLSSVIEAELFKYSGYCTVAVSDGNVALTIEKSVTMLSRLKRKLTEIVSQVPGVKGVEIRLGVNYYSTTIIRKYEFETPSRILLVDDEKEFVHTLSERLKVRQFDTDVVYSGQDALNYTADGNTEVMVLDLKMPGIDGYEVLKKVKADNPDTEVIILTGHGSEKDRAVCLELGAFAYLQKPADIEKLTSVMKEAYQKINLKKSLAAG